MMNSKSFSSWTTPSGFSARIPVILGTPTINRVMQTMKETEMHSTPTERQMARVAYEWAQGFQFQRASLGERLKFPTNTAEDPLDLDEKVLLADRCTIPDFQSVVAHGRTQKTFADFKKPFLLETGTSIEGLGAVLSQKQDNDRYHPITYASRGLKGGELKYHSSKLEFLALEWAVTEQFREYLQYQPFLVRTDNNPLTYVMTTPNLDAIGHRWVAAMAGYNFEIEYIRRMDNKVTDTLSRVGKQLDEEAVKELLDQGAIKELLNHAVHYSIPIAEANDPRVVEEHEKAEGEIIMQA